MAPQIRHEAFRRPCMLLMASDVSDATPAGGGQRGFFPVIAAARPSPAAPAAGETRAKRFAGR